jgi:hypothetical protein
MQVAAFGDLLFKDIPASKMDGSLTGFIGFKYGGAKYLWQQLAWTKR